MSIRVLRPGRRWSVLVPALCLLLSSAACGEAAASMTVAATGTGAEPAAWSDRISEIAVRHATAAVRAGDGAVTVLIGPDAPAATVDLTPLRTPTEVEQDVELAHAKAEGRLGELRELLGRGVPAAAGLDLLETFRRAVDATPAPGTVVLVSSGVQTVDPLDLRRLGWDFDPVAVADDLAARGLVPQARGRVVVLLGLGNTAGSQPRLPLPAAAKVVQLWHAICVRSGASGCEESAGGPPGAAPGARPEVPLVPVELPGTRCRGAEVLPASVLFARDEPTLAPGADEALRPVAERLKQCPAGRVATFTGHTAAVPDGDRGFSLSLDRATAVRDRLGALGVPRSLLGPVNGIGSTRPLVDNLPGGVFTESLAALNRRVEITVTTTP